MNRYRLDFMTLIDHENGIVETIVDEGEDVSGEKLLQLIELLNGLPDSPSALLINRVNSYSMGFGVFPVIPKNKVIKIIAVVNHGKNNQFIPSNMWPKFLPISFFNDYDEASTWLSNRLAFAELS